VQSEKVITVAVAIRKLYRYRVLEQRETCTCVSTAAKQTSQLLISRTLTVFEMPKVTRRRAPKLVSFVGKGEILDRTDHYIHLYLKISVTGLATLSRTIPVQECKNFKPENTA
jgi:hypothetical protein